MSIHEQIAQARKEVQGLKKTSPHIFPQWQALQDAKRELEQAKIKYQRAKSAWKSVGEDK